MARDELGYNPDMTNRNRSVWPRIVYPLLVVLLYVLSVGPAYALTARIVGGHPEYAWMGRIFFVVYAPLEWVFSHSQSAAHALEWYMKLWLPPMP